MSDLEGLGETPDEIVLTAADIPAAELSGPWDKHPVATLKWWLLCRGIEVPTSIRRKELIDRSACFASFLIYMGLSFMHKSL
jgi:hypothetical protein